MLYCKSEAEVGQKKQPELTNVFPTKIVEAQLPSPHKLKIQYLESYKSWTYPTYHIAYFESTTTLLDLDNEMNCHIFFITFKKLAIIWF